nr:NPCBM/NEW2 domain-containing protein [uncultured Schaedlerella sp.]
MNSKIAVAVITGVCGIIAGAIGGAAVTNIVNTNNTIDNSNTLIFTNSAGESKEVTAEDFAEIQKDNQDLKEELEESNKKLQETLASNMQKSEEIKLSNKNFIDLLYDGKEYKTYKSSDGSERIKIGGREYTDAFRLGGGYSKDSAFVLVNLERQYSLVNFEVGRVDDTTINNINLRIYLDNNLSAEYTIDAQTPLTPLEINLSGATTLKIEMVPEEYDTYYGFINFNLQ